MKKIVFIDRDGVVNKDPEGWTDFSYVTKWDDFIFLPGALDAIKLLNDAGFMVAVISNQAGISKKYFTQEELDLVTDKFKLTVEEHGGKIAGVFYCTHSSADNCECRKPKPGLFKKAEECLGIKSKGSFFIGDTERDMEAGKKYGLKTILVLAGKTHFNDIQKWAVKPDYIFKDLYAAARFIIDKVKKI